MTGNLKLFELKKLEDTRMKIVIINGSARKGNTLTAINAFIKGASKKNEIEIIEPKTYEENYRILIQRIREFNENIPPLINAYMKYVLENVPADGTLVFSFIGMKTVGDSGNVAGIY